MVATADASAESVEGAGEAQVVSTASGRVVENLGCGCRRSRVGERSPVSLGGDEAGCTRVGRDSGNDRARRKDAEVRGGGGHNSIDGEDRADARVGSGGCGRSGLHGGCPGVARRRGGRSWGGRRRGHRARAYRLGGADGKRGAGACGRVRACRLGGGGWGRREERCGRRRGVEVRGRQGLGKGGSGRAEEAAAAEGWAAAAEKKNKF
jgi:hypothetical protein